MKKQFFFLLKKNILKLLFLLINIFLILKNINKNKELKVCLCTIGKKENLYASEFVEHYKKIGYDKIFIYDNNDIGDERFENVLNKHISSNLFKSSIIEVIEVKGKAHNQMLLLIVMKKIKIIMIGYLFLILMNFLK